MTDPLCPCVSCEAGRRTAADSRDRVDRNEDGSLDDIVLCLEPDLMLRAEEMDDGEWWICIYDESDKDRSLTVNLAVTDRRRKRGRWKAYIDNENLAVRVEGLPAAMKDKP